MAQRLTYLERRVLRYHGMPANDVARVEKLTVHEVLEVRAGLRSRGHAPTVPGLDIDTTEQLGFGDIDQMMRSNQAPRDSEGSPTAIDGDW